MERSQCGMVCGSSGDGSGYCDIGYFSESTEIVYKWKILKNSRRTCWYVGCFVL